MKSRIAFSRSFHSGRELLIVAMFLVGCGLVPEKVTRADPRVQALLEARRHADTAALGFTPIPDDAQITLEGPSSHGGYDAMLHIYGGTSRTVAFRKTSEGFRWVAEQEVHEGPAWHRTVDGNFRENIVVEFQTEPINGIPTNQVIIRYTGGDVGLAWPRELTLTEIQPILEKWRQAPVEQKPPDLPGADFDPGLLMFALVMLAAWAFMICASFLIGGFFLAFVGIMVAAGVLSASVAAGILNRSISAGFRAFFLFVGTIFGGGIGAAATSVIISMSKAGWNSTTYWIVGTLGGTLLGLVWAWLFNIMWSRVAHILKDKIERRN